MATSEASISDTEKLLCCVQAAISIHSVSFQQDVVFAKLCHGYDLCLPPGLWYSVFSYIIPVNRSAISGTSALDDWVVTQ